jgi:hypothetical protein
VTTQLELTGVQRKEAALDEHEDRRHAAIRWLRKTLKALYEDRITHGAVAYVSADDARTLYEGSNFPPEYAANRTFFGSIFRGNDWEPTGERIQSTHPSNNARSIMCWRPAPGVPVESQATTIRDSHRRLVELYTKHGPMTDQEAHQRAIDDGWATTLSDIRGRRWELTPPRGRGIVSTGTKRNGQVVWRLDA